MRSLLQGVVLAGGLTVAATVGAQALSGTYVAVEEPGVRLELDEQADGTLNGTLAENGATLSLRAQRVAGGFAGTIEGEGARLPLAGQAQGAELLLQIGAPDQSVLVLFRRAGDAPAAPSGSGVAPAQTASTATVNGLALGEGDLAQLANQYGIRIPAGDFWYDAVLGAWGPRGGPTMGFIAPGLPLGGALAADASGGGTQVFVNGRELHPYDLLALQRVTGPILPGRYFIQANGLAGSEGGPPMWNLAALAAQAAGGGSNTWQSRVLGASGFSDGTTGAVFLPNGGIVSTGN